ncbi:A/G-specific adenine glycosylase [Granulicella pectinivorans]|uniref:A/G-specific adenine glycosylase n=1 Tax=Granulicella pectinivorans TaxID=474950 RepID=UPI000B7E2AF4|nr:A/G-specific adenine glycosylase [Granulicella pectinivorans]
MALELEVKAFRRMLGSWYKQHARVLPWRESADPYRVWVSEIMLQQTRVAAVIEHYTAFMKKFPTVVALALADEAEVLAAWSGLGYYRRARMLHKAAQFCTREMGGIIPRGSTELRTLPGVGEYTSAAIASIAFGESVAVVDGNVERVVFRIMGKPEDTSSVGRAFVREVAGALVPPKRMLARIDGLRERVNAAGDHNQAMMELGAMICTPRAPLCLECPVYSLCQTKGEHVTVPRGKQQSKPADFLLALRKAGTSTEVLLVQRSAEASLMASMYELPALPIDAAGDTEPMLRLRHSITNTNYYVQIFGDTRELRRELVAKEEDLTWIRTSKLGEIPLTGLARKVLRRLGVIEIEAIG